MVYDVIEIARFDFNAILAAKTENIFVIYDVIELKIFNSSFENHVIIINLKFLAHYDVINCLKTPFSPNYDSPNPAQRNSCVPYAIL